MQWLQTPPLLRPWSLGSQHPLPLPLLQTFEAQVLCRLFLLPYVDLIHLDSFKRVSEFFAW